MSHSKKIKLSTPLRRHYNIIGIHQEDDLDLEFDLTKHPQWDSQWKDSGYNLTIYKESDRSTVLSVGVNSDELTITLADYDDGSIRLLAVVEDRSDPANIDAIATIAYFIFKQFPGGVERTLQGHVEYEQADTSLLSIPYYSTGLITP